MSTHLLDSYRPNAFTDAVLGLTVAPDRVDQQTIVSRAMIDSFEGAIFDEYGYGLSQVFEPSVLWEVCRFEGLDHDDVEALRTPTTEPVAALRWLIDHLDHATTLQRINLANALLSVARCRLAGDVLASIDVDRIDARQRYEVAMASFILSNRADGGRDSAGCFQRMREAIEAGAVPADEVLDASAHAIVWYLKTGEVDAALLRWFVKAGLDAARQGVSPVARSSWYRAYAMIPAERRDAAQTRAVMERAHDDAKAAIAACDDAGTHNLLKTYLESSLKEYLYVHRDLDAAKQMGLSLIKLDPAWAPSYGELADVYEKAGDHATVAQLLERALDLGAPYRLFHAYRLAHARGRLGDHDGALGLLAEILEIDPTAVSACLVGYKQARAIGHATAPRFAEALTALEPTLAPAHRDYLEAPHVGY